MVQSRIKAPPPARWTVIGLWVVISGLFVTLYGPILAASAGSLPTTMFDDFISLFYPAAEIFRGLAHDGEWPLWNPYSFCGMPFLASIQMGSVYPPNWLHLVVSPTRAFNWLLVGHAVFAGYGTWLYCRGQSRSAPASIFAAVVFAVCGRVILQQFAGHPHIVYSAAWLPFIFWALDRCLTYPSLRRGCVLALALALHFLTGFPMLSLLLAYLIPVYVLMFSRPSTSKMAQQWEPDSTEKQSASLNSATSLHDLAGHTAPAFHGWTTPRAFVFFGVVGVLALGLVAVQVLPTVEYMNHSHRGQGLDYDWSTTSSYPPINLITYLVPGFFGDEVTCPYWGETSLWESTAFCGVTTILLALIGLLKRPDRNTVFWAAAGFFTLLVAMGKYSYFYDACYSILPGVKLFRGVSKLNIFVTLTLSILASRGFDIAFSRNSSVRGVAKLACVAALGVGVIGFAGAALESMLDAPAPLWWQSFFDWVRSPGTFTLLKIPAHNKLSMQTQSYGFVLTKVMTAACFLAAAALVVLNGKQLRKAGGAILTGLVCVELFLFAHPYLQVSDTTPYREPARKVRAAIHDSTPWRFCCVATGDHLVNQFAYEKLPSLGGVEASLLTRYTLLFGALTGADPQLMTYLTMPVVHESLFDLLNVKYYAATPQTPRLGDSSHDKLLVAGLFVTNGKSYDLYENTDALPRAMIVHEAREIDYMEGGRVLVRRLLLEGPETASFVEGQLPFSLESVTADEAANESCRIASYRPSRTTIEVELQRPGLVLVVENAYPGWQADVDGSPVKILPANLAMQAIPVPAGRHTINLRFESVTFQRGAGISCAALTVIVIVLLWSACRPQSVVPFVRASPNSRAEKVASTGRSGSIGTQLVGMGYYGGLVVFLLACGGWLYGQTADVVPPSLQYKWWTHSAGPFAIAAGVLVAVCGWQLLRTHRRRFVFGTILFALVLPFTLIVAEGVSRIFVPRWPAIGLHGVPPEEALRSWAKGTSSDEGIGLNDWGQRDRPRSLEPPNRVHRIAFVGDSFLEESTKTPVSIQVEDGIGRNDVEVINLGVSATSPDEYYFRIRNIAMNLDVEHCVMFVYAGNDFAEAEQTLAGYWGIAAVYPRGSLLSSVGLTGLNHLLTNRHRPVLQAWLGAQDLRKEEELRFLTISESSDDQIRQLLLSAAKLPAEQAAVLQARLADPRMAEFFEMLRNPDDGQFRSYYLSRGLWAAASGTQWDYNSETGAAYWVQQAADLCQSKGVGFTLVIVPEAFAVDSRMVRQWAPLTDMRHLTAPCQEAAQRLREHASAAGIDVIDLHDAFKDVPGTYLNMDGHWSNRGVKLAAKVLIKKLAQPPNLLRAAHSVSE